MGYECCSRAWPATSTSRFFREDRGVAGPLTPAAGRPLVGQLLEIQRRPRNQDPTVTSWHPVFTASCTYAAGRKRRSASRPLRPLSEHPDSCLPLHLSLPPSLFTPSFLPHSLDLTMTSVGGAAPRFPLVRFDSVRRILVAALGTRHSGGCSCSLALSSVR